MIFGKSRQFAIEVIAEPGPELPPVVGACVAGRMRLLIGGMEFGDFNEPCCVLGPICDHLLDLTRQHISAWHRDLQDLTPEQQFYFLDELFYIGSRDNAEHAKELKDCNFLTNVGEMFDDYKGFALTPPIGGHLLMLRNIRGNEVSPVSSFLVPTAEIRQATNEFATWLRAQEKSLNSLYG